MKNTHSVEMQNMRCQGHDLQWILKKGKGQRHCMKHWKGALLKGRHCTSAASVCSIVEEVHDPVEDMQKLDAHHVNEDPTNSQLASLQWLAKAGHNPIHESGVPTWVKGSIFLKKQTRDA